MAQKPKKQSELMDQLRDNSKKEISPENLRDAVASANAPILIWSGKVHPYLPDTHPPETIFMNPYYFNTGEGTSGLNTTVWKIESASVPGAAAGTYTATSTSQGNFRAKITVSDETVTRFEILDPGFGQVSGETYTVTFDHGDFKMKFNGPVFVNEGSKTYFYFRGKGSDGSYHTPVNTFMLTNNESHRGEFASYIKDYGSNVYGFYIRHDEGKAKLGVSIWKIIGA